MNFGGPWKAVGYMLRRCLKIWARIELKTRMESEISARATGEESEESKVREVRAVSEAIGRSKRELFRFFCRSGGSGGQTNPCTSKSAALQNSNPLHGCVPTVVEKKFIGPDVHTPQPSAIFNARRVLLLCIRVQEHHIAQLELFESCLAS